MPALIGPLVAAARQAAGMTQTGLGEAAGVPQSHVAAIEGGRANPSTEMLARLGHALGVDPGALLPDLERIRSEFGADLAGLQKSGG
jgi:transcriptional regulator with XRE-family HTH domain